MRSHIPKIFEQLNVCFISGEGKTMMPDPGQKQTQTLTTLYAVRPEWMLGPVAFFASLHHRWHVRTYWAKSTNLQLTEQLQWIQLAADHLGSYRNIKNKYILGHQISVYFLQLKYQIPIQSSHIPPSLLKMISKKMFAALLTLLSLWPRKATEK